MARKSDCRKNQMPNIGKDVLNKYAKIEGKPTMPRGAYMIHNKATGFLLILLGVLLFAYKSSWVPFDSFFTWPFALFLLGTALIFFAFINAIAPFALIGGIISTLGISVWGLEHVTGWPRHWGILAVMLGISFLLQFMINRNNMSALIGSILVTSGVLTWPGIREIPGIAPVANLFTTYWPILLVCFGVLLIRK